jgi:hypothetical protein
MSPILGQIYTPFFYPELTIHRCKNRKILHESKILQEIEPAPCV